LAETVLETKDDKGMATKFRWESYKKRIEERREKVDHEYRQKRRRRARNLDL